MEPTTIGVFVEVAVGVAAASGIIWRRLNGVEKRLADSLDKITNSVNGVKIEMAKINGKVINTASALAACQAARCDYHDSLSKTLSRLQSEQQESRHVMNEHQRDHVKRRVDGEVA